MLDVTDNKPMLVEIYLKDMQKGSAKRSEHTHSRSQRKIKLLNTYMFN